MQKVKKELLKLLLIFQWIYCSIIYSIINLGYKISSRTALVPKYDKNKMKKPTNVILAALLPLQPNTFLKIIRNINIIHATIDNIVLCAKCCAKISSRKKSPDKRLADKNNTPRANILNNKLSIASSEGREAIRPIGWLDFNFFS